MIARWIARLAHQVVVEYRKLDAPAAAAAPAEISCTQARTDARWQPTDIAPASARAEFGFRAPPVPVVPGQTYDVILRTGPLPVAHECVHQASNFTPCRVCGA